MTSDLSQFNLIGSSTQFKRVVWQINRLSSVDATVLIEGETGTGKELAARALHYLGGRHDRPFVPVNCGAISDTLVESELFGHERGAFTDAKTPSAGLVGQANGGTLFLDEVEALSPKAQAALLRFLQDGTYRRVGGTSLHQSDVRIIAASNRDLDKMAQEQLFRRDLLYRLNLLLLHMPPLREREGDALELARVFMARLSSQYRLPEKHFHLDAIAFVENHPWPGNVRELENVIHREFLMCEGTELRLTDSRVHVAAEKSETAARGARFKEAKAKAIAEFERRYLHDLLSLAEGNISQAARLSGKDRSALGKLVRKHGLVNRKLIMSANIGG